MSAKLITAVIPANDGGVIPPFPISPLSEKWESFIRKCVDVIYVVFSLYGFSVDGVSRKNTYNHWIYCSSLLWAAKKDPMVFVKYKIAAFYSYHKHQELPKILSSVACVDKPGIILGGDAYKWFNIQLNKGTPYLIEGLITSVLYSKKGMPRPGKLELKRAELEAFEKLTTVPIQPPESLISWGDIPDHLSNKVITLLNQQTVHAQIVRTVKEIFEGEIYNDDDRVEPFVPSTSANYINSRVAGGAVGVIIDDPELIDGLRTKDELVTMRIVNPMSRHNKLVVDSSPLRAKFITLYSRIVSSALKELPYAIPLALPEALKKRVISKGPPYLYTALKPLQKKMWSVIARKVKAAKLISQPIDARYIQSRMGAKLKPDEAYLSVDYSDATNEMFSWCSESAANEVSNCLMLSDDERTLFVRALTGHLMQLSAEQIVYEGGVKQERGQLMGSIVSFPILCIVNLAICRWSMEIAHKRVYTLNDAPIAVNGDDGLLRINISGKKAWEKIASYCGLLPSVGKVYYSREFLNMNSTTYNYHKDGWEGYTYKRESDNTIVRRVCNFELVPYVNLGLLFNLQRSGVSNTQDKNDQQLSIGTRCRELIRLCPVSLQEKVMSYFLCHSRDTLGKYHIPWFIPQHLGGLGFPTVGRFRPVDRDLRLARKIYNHYVVPPKPVKTNWKIWNYAKKRFPYLPITSAVVVEGLNLPVVSRAKVLSLACVEALFRVDKLSDLYEEPKSRGNYFGALEKLWRKACLDKHPFPEPFNPENYPYEEKFDDLMNYYDFW